MSESLLPEVTGSVFRGYIAAVEKRGFLPAFRDRVQPATRALIDKPPFPMTWLGITVVEDVLTSIEALRGRDEVRAVVRGSTQISAGPALKEMLKFTMNLFGTGPAALYQQMQGICSTTIRNVEFRWRPTGDKGGEMEILTRFRSWTPSTQPGKERSKR